MNIRLNDFKTVDVLRQVKLSDIHIQRIRAQQKRKGD